MPDGFLSLTEASLDEERRGLHPHAASAPGAQCITALAVQALASGDLDAEIAEHALVAHELAGEVGEELDPERVVAVVKETAARTVESVRIDDRAVTGWLIAQAEDLGLEQPAASGHAGRILLTRVQCRRETEPSWAGADHFWLPSHAWIDRGAKTYHAPIYDGRFDTGDVERPGVVLVSGPSRGTVLTRLYTQLYPVEADALPARLGAGLMGIVRAICRIAAEKGLAAAKAALAGAVPEIGVALAIGGPELAAKVDELEDALESLVEDGVRRLMDLLGELWDNTLGVLEDDVFEPYGMKLCLVMQEQGGQIRWALWGRGTKGWQFLHSQFGPGQIDAWTELNEVTTRFWTPGIYELDFVAEVT